MRQGWRDKSGVHAADSPPHPPALHQPEQDHEGEDGEESDGG